MRHLIPFIPSPPLVTVLRLHGMIAAQARGGALSDAGLAALIEKAFRRGKPAAVALAVNSPGGSPAQSSLIASRLRRHADETGTPLLAFVEDVAASGGYYLASAADEIWVDRHSIVGSIGVISAGFGLHEFIGRHGIERRLYTAGRSKSLLDPFRPENPDDVARLRAIQEEIHAGFIAHVRERRGGRLNEDMELFTGEIWAGAQALPTGLVDGVGHLVPKIKERYGDKVRFRVLQQRRPFLSRIGASLAGDALAEAEGRAAFARFGL